MKLRRRLARLVRRRVVRPLTRLTRLQVAVLAVMLIAAVGGAAALVIVLNPHSAAVQDAGSGPPLQLPRKEGAPSPSLAPGLPATVELTVPGGGIDIHVVEGDGVHVPLHLAMHYPGTSWPGGGGSSLFYAHAQPGMFLGLYSIHVGAEIRALRADGSQVLYQVRSIRRVAYDDATVLEHTAFEQITLLTCTSYNPTTPRYIVVGTPA